MNNQNVNYLRARWMIADRFRMYAPPNMFGASNAARDAAYDYINALKQVVYGPDRKARF